MPNFRHLTSVAFIIASLGLAWPAVADTHCNVNPCTPDDGPEPTAKKNNGWGNGDQDAPGNSEFRNGAENNPHNGDNTANAPGKSGH